MRRLQVVLKQVSLVMVLLLACSQRHALADEKKVEPGERSPWVTTIDLITIGPGEHLFSRMGHSALMVFTFREDAQKLREQAATLVRQAKADPTRAQELRRKALALAKKGKEYKAAIYNYGDADFDADDFEWQFLRGTVEFRISKSESLPGFIETYGRSNRGMTHQRLNLSAAQIKRVAAALEENLKPANRYYPYHHMEAGCATKIRDLLDAELGGIIRKQFESQIHPMTARGIGRKHLAGHPGAEIFSDLFMGRLHDRPFDKYYAMFHPDVLVTYLQQVKVPDPAGSGAQVPLLDPKVSTFLTRKCRPEIKEAEQALQDPRRAQQPPQEDCSPARGEGRSLIHLTYLMIALLLGVLIFALRGQPRNPRRAGEWLLLWSVPMGIAALAMVVGALASTVIEGRVNELMLCFPVTDLALVAVGIRWLRGRGTAGKLLRGYAMVRLAMAALAAVLHAVGVFYQEPRVMVVLALVCTAGLVVLTRHMPVGADVKSKTKSGAGSGSGFGFDTDADLDVDSDMDLDV